MNIEDINAADLANLTAQGYTESDLAMLADKEVRSLLLPDDHDEEETGTNASDDPHADAAAAQDAAAEPAQAVEEEPVAEVATQSFVAPFVPQYNTEVPADAKEQIAALKSEERTAYKQVMAGEIEPDAYQDIRDRVETAVDELKTKVLTASIFAQANEQATEQILKASWRKETADAFQVFKAEGVDYQANPEQLAVFNHYLTMLGTEADVNNTSSRNRNRDGQWFLTEAHRLTKDDLGIVAKTLPTASRKGVDPADLPPTLRSVPVAATGTVNADEFAHLRNLSGLAMERAHAAMTESQRDRWMAE